MIGIFGDHVTARDYDDWLRASLTYNQPVN